MLNFFKKMFGAKVKPKIQARLSEEEAINIACQTEIASDHKELMTLTSLIEREGKFVWVISSATIGSMIEVIIDDETGNVIKAGRVGKR